MAASSYGIQEPLLSFGVIADVQYADAADGYNFAKTQRRYYRTALSMLDKAVCAWNSDKRRKPEFVLQLGDAIDGCNRKLGISESSLAAVLKSLSAFHGPAYHVWGNHEYYNFSRETLISSDLYSGNLANCTPVNGRAYYSSTPHPQLRILALDCYEISILASPKDSKHYITASQIMENNCNEDKNSVVGLEGMSRRFAQYNGALSEEQLTWIEANLQEASCLKQNVIFIGHCGIYYEATDSSCLCWNAPETLDIIHKYSDCVLAYFSGHDHAGGMANDQKDILHIAFPGVLENNVDSDFGTFYMHKDKLELAGNGRVLSMVIPLKYHINDTC